MLSLLCDKTLEKSKSLRIACKHHQRKQYIIKKQELPPFKTVAWHCYELLVRFFNFNAQCDCNLKVLKLLFEG